MWVLQMALIVMTFNRIQASSNYIICIHMHACIPLLQDNDMYFALRFVDVYLSSVSRASSDPSGYLFFKVQCNSFMETDSFRILRNNVASTASDSNSCFICGPEDACVLISANIESLRTPKQSTLCIFVATFMKQDNLNVAQGERFMNQSNRWRFFLCLLV